LVSETFDGRHLKAKRVIGTSLGVYIFLKRCISRLEVMSRIDF